MTSTNINYLEQAVSEVQNLDIEDRLGLLAVLYSQVANSIPVDDLEAIAQPSIHSLVLQIQQLSPEEQLTVLSELLLEDDNLEDTSNDVVEIASAANYSPTKEYQSLDSESKLAFWSVIAGKLGETIIGIPQEYKPAVAVTKVLDFLKSLNNDELVVFLKQVI